MQTEAARDDYSQLRSWFHHHSTGQLPQRQTGTQSVWRRGVAPPAAVTLHHQLCSQSTTSTKYISLFSHVLTNSTVQNAFSVYHMCNPAPLCIFCSNCVYSVYTFPHVYIAYLFIYLLLLLVFLSVTTPPPPCCCNTANFSFFALVFCFYWIVTLEIYKEVNRFIKFTKCFNVNCTTEKH